MMSHQHQDAMRQHEMMNQQHLDTMRQHEMMNRIMNQQHLDTVNQQIHQDHHMMMCGADLRSNILDTPNTYRGILVEQILQEAANIIPVAEAKHVDIYGNDKRDDRLTGLVGKELIKYHNAWEKKYVTAWSKDVRAYCNKVLSDNGVSQDTIDKYGIKFYSSSNASEYMNNCIMTYDWGSSVYTTEYAHVAAITGEYQKSDKSARNAVDNIASKLYNGVVLMLEQKGYTEPGDGVYVRKIQGNSPEYSYDSYIDIAIVRKVPADILKKAGVIESVETCTIESTSNPETTSIDVTGMYYGTLVEQILMEFTGSGKVTFKKMSGHYGTTYAISKTFKGVSIELTSVNINGNNELCFDQTQMGECVSKGINWLNSQWDSIYRQVTKEVYEFGKNTWDIPFKSVEEMKKYMFVDHITSSVKCSSDSDKKYNLDSISFMIWVNAQRKNMSEEFFGYHSLTLDIQFDSSGQMTSNKWNLEG